MDLEKRLHNQLEHRKEENSFRQLIVGSNLVDFSSNDYLGLARSETLFGKIATAAGEQRRNGASGSRLLSGNSVLAENLEKKLAGIFNAETTLLFNSGYTANLGLLSTLPQRGDTILYDELSHACIKDGMRLSLAQRYAFRHNDLENLEAKLKKASGAIFIIAEAIYSMDGDVCPLYDLLSLSKKYNAHLILDEAHSTGILGIEGGGLSSMLGVEKELFARIYTFGKAMGVHGAAIAGSYTLRNYLINYCRPFIYTTALPPHSLIAIAQAFDYLGENSGLQKLIQSKIKHFQQEFDLKLSINFIKTPSDHAIQSIIIPGNDIVKHLAEQLQNKGYDVRPILSPTVKTGEERLRICLHTYNTDMEISELMDSLAATV